MKTTTKPLGNLYIEEIKILSHKYCTTPFRKRINN